MALLWSKLTISIPIFKTKTATEYKVQLMEQLFNQWSQGRLLKFQNADTVSKIILIIVSHYFSSHDSQKSTIIFFKSGTFSYLDRFHTVPLTHSSSWHLYKFYSILEKFFQLLFNLLRYFRNDNFIERKNIVSNFHGTSTKNLYSLLLFLLWYILSNVYKTRKFDLDFALNLHEHSEQFQKDWMSFPFPN